jgi:hypothetical protein
MIFYIIALIPLFMSIHTKSLLNTAFNDVLYNQFKSAQSAQPISTQSTQLMTLDDIKKRQVNLFQSILTQQQLHTIPDLPYNPTKSILTDRQYTPSKSNTISQPRSSSQKARRARIKNKYTNKVFRNLYTEVIEKDPNRYKYQEHISTQIWFFFIFVFCGSIFGIIFAARTTDTVLGVTIGIISSILLFVVTVYSYIVERINGDASESTGLGDIFYFVSFFGSIAGLITFSIKAHNLTK